VAQHSQLRLLQQIDDILYVWTFEEISLPVMRRTYDAARRERDVAVPAP
jgi:hypothetical protein